MKALVIVILATVFGCLLTSLGYILMKRSHKVAAVKGCSNYLTWEFLTGFTICCLSAVINMGKTLNFEFNIICKIVSLAFADIITLSSLAGLTIVFNTIFSITIQKE